MKKKLYARRIAAVLIIGITLGYTALFPAFVFARAAETHIVEVIVIKGEPQFSPRHVFICPGDSVLVFNNSHSYDSSDGFIENIFSYSPNIPEHQKAVLQNLRGVTIYPSSRISPGYSDRYLIGPFTKIGTAFIHSAWHVKASFRITVLDCTKKGVQTLIPKKQAEPPAPTPINIGDSIFQ